MNLSPAESLALLPASQRKQVLAGLSEAQYRDLAYDWKFWGRPNQIAPEGDWITWLLLAGRGFGKTRSGSEWIRSIVCGKTPLAAGTHHRLAIIAETAADARDVLVEGDSGILAVHPNEFRPLYEPSKRRLTWPNGAIATLYNAVEPDQLRGPQHDAALCFIAGTMISTPRGDRPIETIRTGALVQTRLGPRRVLNRMSRTAGVGLISASDGKYLIGTADHKVYTPNGWTRMDHLSEGDGLCVIDVSNGAGSGGISTGTDAGCITRERIRALSRGEQLGCIARFMLSTMGKLTKGLMSTISTTTSRTMTFLTSLRFHTQTIGNYISNRNPFVAIGGRSNQSSCNVAIAGSKFGASKNLTGKWFASPVARSDPLPKGLATGHARTVEQSLEAQTEIFAASVVSTWQPRGEQDVFCLTVEDHPEYFANGILVHNCDELAKWHYVREAWDQLQFGLRIGDNPRQVITTTPRNIPVLKEIIAAKTTVITRGSTFENRHNLAPAFLKTIVQKYHGTRLGRQELDAELLDDLPGALWTRAMFDETRLSEAPEMARVVVAVDPSGTKGQSDDGDEIGIIVAGKGIDGRGYVLADRTCKLSPDGWGRRAVAAYHEFGADRIVAERNFGGAMVEHVIRTVDNDVSYKAVTASRGKIARAEPIAALFEQKRISHVGAMPELEDQACEMAPDGFAGEGSPDRVDALVWALTELFGGTSKPFEWFVGS